MGTKRRPRSLRSPGPRMHVIFDHSAASRSTPGYRFMVMLPRCAVMISSCPTTGCVAPAGVPPPSLPMHSSRFARPTLVFPPAQTVDRLDHRDEADQIGTTALKNAYRADYPPTVLYH